MNNTETLPLTEVELEVLISLSDDVKHGYAIIQEVADRTSGRLRLHAGTLYRALNRMLEDGLIEEVDRPESEPDTDARRRYYAISKLGLRVGRAELARLTNQIHNARAAGLKPRAAR